MLLDNEFTGDMRVENEVISLAKNGFNVTVLCLNHGTKKSEEDFHGARIIRISISLFMKNKMKGLTNTIFDFWKSYWWKQIKKIDGLKEYDAIHAHDLHMVPIALKAKEKLNNGVKVVADLHENYPEAMKHYKYSNTFPGNLIISVKKWERKEIEWLKQCDQVITVIDEAVNRYIKLGVDASKIIVVQNYVNTDVFDTYTLNSEITEKFKGKFVVSYIGGFDDHRGLHTLIKAIHILKNKVNNIHLLLVGRGINFEQLKELSDTLDMKKHISFEGWQPPTALPSYINASDVCIIPHKKTVHTDNTIPHKLFHYMMYRRPIIASNCTPMERILHESKTGLVFESGNEVDLSEKIFELYQNDEQREAFGQNGEIAIQERYSWKEAAKSMVTYYSATQK